MTLWQTLMDKADKRTDQLFLMSTPIPAAIMSIAYVYIVKVSRTKKKFFFLVHEQLLEDIHE